MEIFGNIKRQHFKALRPVYLLFNRHWEGGKALPEIGPDVRESTSTFCSVMAILAQPSMALQPWAKRINKQACPAAQFCFGARFCRVLVVLAAAALVCALDFCHLLLLAACMGRPSCSVPGHLQDWFAYRRLCFKILFKILLHFFLYFTFLPSGGGLFDPLKNTYSLLLLCSVFKGI